MERRQKNITHPPTALCLSVFIFSQGVSAAHISKWFPRVETTSQSESESSQKIEGLLFFMATVFFLHQRLAESERCQFTFPRYSTWRSLMMRLLRFTMQKAPSI